MKQLKLILLALCLLSALPTTLAQVPDSVDFPDYYDKIEIFEKELTFGRNIGFLYFEGDAKEDLIIEVVSDKKGHMEFVLDEDKGWYKMDYLGEPVMTIKYKEQSFQLTVKLVQVADPGNEIAWKMIPRIYFSRK